MKSIRIVSHEGIRDDLEFWLEKSPEERLETVEFLREQFFAVQGYAETPRIKKIVRQVEME